MALSNNLFSSFSSPIISNDTVKPTVIHVNAHSTSLAYTNTVTHDFSLVSAPPQDYMGRYHQKLNEVSELLHSTKSPLECVIKIDALQQLAIDYHFSDEIEDILSRHYRWFMGSRGAINFGRDCDLYDVSLHFRLLRQNGHHVPTDVFNRFLDKERKFKESLSNDLRGIMGLYEASQLGIEGEDLLDQANAFTSKHLRDSVALLGHDNARHALDNPQHKSLARFSVKHCIKIFEMGVFGTLGSLEELAKTDFNIVQSQYQDELKQVSKWWRDLGLGPEMKFARDQPLKWHMWSLAMVADPRLSRQRIELTKPISLIYILDDIFDVYGTFDELVLLTEAINKWEFDAIDHLPYCMKIFFKALYDVTNEISNKVLKEHGWNPVYSLRKSWTNFCDALLVEAKWFASGHLPGAGEYLKNAVITSGVDVAMIHVFFLLGHGINKDTVELLDRNPGLISCPATILRLWDDLGSAKDENQEGYDGSYIECYMKEHKNSTIENAREQVVNMISNEWKKLNKECLLPNPFPLSMRKTSLNSARMVQLMYSYDEDQRLPMLEKQIKSVLHESIPLDR